MTEQQQQRMLELTAQLNAASDAYYNGRPELMTDYEWNERFDELAALEAATGTVLADSPTQRVSADDLAGQKEDHEFAALSLAKTKRTDELVAWAEGRPIHVSWKLDGLTLVATYDGGRLQKVVTRGNGHTGTNITHLSTAIAGLPQRIPAQGHTVIRGEAVISYADFEQFCMESDEDYANPRNLASGSLTLKDVAEVRQRHIRWIPFTLVYADDDLPTFAARMDWLARQGFQPVDHELIADPTLPAVEAAIARWTERVTSGQCPYPVDGLVITYDDTAYAATGSVTGHHATRAGLAFKWQDEQAETVLERIEWSCAASTISPVAVFAPVQLEGTTVRRASLCNISELERLGIGDRGTRLAVIKANKIIPKVVSVLERVGVLQIPTACPVCQAPTEVATRGNADTRTLHCTNAACPAKQLRRLARFVSKDGMDIDGLSEQTLARLINLGWVSEYADIYLLRSHLLELSTLDGFGQRSATKLMQAIDRSRTVTAEKLLYALNIPLCGKDVCRRLLAAHGLSQLTDTARTSGDPAVFSEIDHIGPEKSAQLVAWFHDAQNDARFTRLLAQLTIEEPEPTAAGTRCEGLTFVVTGAVHHYKNRKELQQYIEQQGGVVTGSVSRATSFLINNDVTSTSGKNRKAQELGIPILSEDDFLQRFTDREPAARQSGPIEQSLF